MSTPQTQPSATATPKGPPPTPPPAPVVAPTAQAAQQATGTAVAENLATARMNRDQRLQAARSKAVADAAASAPPPENDTQAEPANDAAAAPVGTPKPRRRVVEVPATEPAADTAPAEAPAVPKPGERTEAERLNAAWAAHRHAEGQRKQREAAFTAREQQHQAERAAFEADAKRIQGLRDMVKSGKGLEIIEALGLSSRELAQRVVEDANKPEPTAAEKELAEMRRMLLDEQEKREAIQKRIDDGESERAAAAEAEQAAAVATSDKAIIRDSFKQAFTSELKSFAHLARYAQHRGPAAMVNDAYAILRAHHENTGERLPLREFFVQWDSDLKSQGYPAFSAQAPAPAPKPSATRVADRGPGTQAQQHEARNSPTSLSNSDASERSTTGSVRASLDERRRVAREQARRAAS